MTAVEPLLPPADLDRLRTALAGFTVDSVHELLGPVGRAAHERGDLAGVGRVLAAADGAPPATLVSLFLLGAAVPVAEVRDALHPLPLDVAVSAGLLATSGARLDDTARARLEIRPYTEAGADERWWVVSDLGSDVRPGPLARDHVLGIGNAALTLAQATPRAPIGRALDVGTGCGVQALHLGRHAGQVVATDISRRALRFAATSAALSCQSWQLRQGSFLDPVAEESFDLVVANPPFVISPGSASAAAAEYDYRDSGQPGDAACSQLTHGIAALLGEGGTGQLLANWIVPVEGTWQERVGGWFPPGCDAWVWQREVVEPGEYIVMWLRDAGFTPGTPDWTRRYDAWHAWFAGHGVAAIGMGLITMSGRSAGSTGSVVAEDVAQPVVQPVGAEIAAWFARRKWLDATGDVDLWRSALRPPAGLVRTRDDLLDADAGWRTRRETLRQTGGLRWEIEVDDAVARLVAACAAGTMPHTALEVLAATGGEDVDALARAFVPALRDLVQRGLLVPASRGTEPA